MALKIYRTLSHSSGKTRYAYICASSKREVAQILKTTVRTLVSYGCEQLNENDPKYALYSNLKSGDVKFEDTQPKASTSGKISYLDLHRISVLGYIDSALLALNNCDMPNRELSQRLGELRHELKELKSDAKELLEQKYAGR